MQQIGWLFRKMTREERRNLPILKDCTREMFITRGLPIAAVVMGGVFALERQMPSAQRRNPLFLYPLTGIGALTLVILFTRRNCLNRAQPELIPLYQKVSVDFHLNSFLCIFHVS